MFNRLSYYVYDRYIIVLHKPIYAYMVFNKVLYSVLYRVFYIGVKKPAL